MRSGSPSVVPQGDHDVYLVLDDFGGRIGQTWRETGVEDANLETVITDLLVSVREHLELSESFL